MTKLIIEINGQVVPTAKIDQWELHRLQHEYRFLKHHGFKFPATFTTALANQDLTTARVALARLKARQAPATWRKLWHRKYSLGNLASKLAATASHRRKYSITDLVLPRTTLTPSAVKTGLETIMLENTAPHQELNLATNPDHFILTSPANQVQEVLEITGGSPLPTRFFAHYGDESGLTSTRGAGFTVQMPGTVRLADGTVIGGVRHQIKREGQGLRFRALVEFPALVPNYMITQHQYHLACEFRQWLGALD